MPLPILKSQTSNFCYTFAGSRKENIFARPFFETLILSPIPALGFIYSFFLSFFCHITFGLLCPYHLFFQIPLVFMYNILRKCEFQKKKKTTSKKPKSNQTKPIPKLPSLSSLRDLIFYSFFFQTPGPSIVLCALHSTKHGSRMKE